MTDHRAMPTDDDPAPPWQAFPGMQPHEMGATQGAQEAWLDGIWRPFWRGMTPAQQADWLDRWQADDAWRDAIRFFSDAPTLDLAADLAESEAWLQARAAERQAERPASLVQRLARRLGKR